eukprot:5859094-Ditylum_brightwellii.AAC.1
MIVTLLAQELQNKQSRKGREQDKQSTPQIATCQEKPPKAATNHHPQETPIFGSEEEGLQSGGNSYQAPIGGNWSKTSKGAGHASEGGTQQNPHRACYH